MHNYLSINFRTGLVILGVMLCMHSMGQTDCPSNIGFEKGTFEGWECSWGSIDTAGNLSLYPTSPMYNTHTLIGRGSAGEKDPYGGFPVLCPNGSGFSVKLGNDEVRSRAEGLSYTFTVPTNATEYSIIYNYAVVLEAPNHQPHQQPKLLAKVFDVALGDYIQCSSFEFVASASLPGFYVSSVKPGVYCKDWAAVTIDLAGLSGKTLRLEFSSNDCAPGAHFGYVYLDVNEVCSSLVSGSFICPNDTAIILTAPFGFNNYNWYTPDFSTLIATGNTLTLNPLPPVGSQYALEVIPFNGLGCRDTIISVIKVVNDQYDLKVKTPYEACKVAGADLTHPSITAGSTANLKFTYHKDEHALQFIGNPARIDSSGVYYIKGTTPNGCRVVKPITVALKDSPRLVINAPPPVVYPVTVDITSSSVTFGSETGLQYSYWRDNKATAALTNPSSINLSGTYYIKAATTLGCINILPVEVIVNPPPPYELIAPNAFSPNGDGINDFFTVGVKGEMTINSLIVYDRWGKLITRVTDLGRGWNGVLNGKHLSAGNYYWVIEGYDHFWKRKVVHAGWVFLIK